MYGGILPGQEKNKKDKFRVKYTYNMITEEVLEELRAIGGSNSVSTSDHDIEGYSYDEMPLQEPCTPQVVVRPAETAAIARLMKFASERKIPVVPRGAGTGVSGGCIPWYGGIVLSLERMNYILEIDCKINKLTTYF